MTKITAAEFQRAPGRVRALALRAPVIVTNHGHADLVVLSADEYDRLKQADRRAVRAADMSDADFALLEAVVVPDQARSFDVELD